MAYIFACKFINNFKFAKDKTVQIYVSLLKSQEYMSQHDNDQKILSRKALDILIPYLPQLENNNQNEQPDWINWTYKIFGEESCILSTNFVLGRFWHMFIKNHKVYFKYRKTFNT